MNVLRSANKRSAEIHEKEASTSVNNNNNNSKDSKRIPLSKRRPKKLKLSDDEFPPTRVPLIPDFNPDHINLNEIIDQLRLSTEKEKTVAELHVAQSLLNELYLNRGAETPNSVSPINAKESLLEYDPQLQNLFSKIPNVDWEKYAILESNFTFISDFVRWTWADEIKPFYSNQTIDKIMVTQCSILW